ncbi:MAG: Gfo/Idh/MocA family oxidoreductase [Candidatus Omnitrophica bacterium]|nr:Gfo/Idh/MocA family oxidoreductase [Candidatus Omnitrophota bacterium]
MKKLAVGVVGIGHLGKEHARIYSQLENVELAGVCDLDPAMEQRARDLGVPFYRDHRELLPKVQAVSVAVPTSQHHAVAKDFLAAGVHSLVEKPITSTLKQADELIESALAHKAVLRVGHVERFNAGFKAVEKVIRNIRFVEIHRLGPFTPRINDCGVVLDLMIHDIDILFGLVGSEIQSLDAVGINVLTPFEDIANVRIRFKSGCIADLTASRLTPERQRKIRIFQDNAYISLDYGAQTAQIFTKDNNAINREQIDITKEESLRNELIDFVDAIRSGAGVGNPDVGARRALEVALKIIEDIKQYQASQLAQIRG